MRPSMYREATCTDFSLDVRRTVRRLTRRPGGALVFVSTLAIGLTAAATATGVVRTLLLRPLPFTTLDRLVLVRDDAPVTGVEQRAPVDSPPSISRRFRSAGRPSKRSPRSGFGLERSARVPTPVRFTWQRCRRASGGRLASAPLKGGRFALTNRYRAATAWPC